MSVMKNNQHVYVSLCLMSLFCFSFIMGGINIAFLNINGAREGKKRFQLFEMVKEKKVDVLFVQETHSDELNQRV